MRIWEERIKRTAHQQLHLSVLTIVNTIYKYFGIQSNMAFFDSKTAKIDVACHTGTIDQKKYFFFQLFQAWINFQSRSVLSSESIVSYVAMRKARR